MAYVVFYLNKETTPRNSGGISQLEYGDDMSRRLPRDATAEPVSRNQILRREREQGNINFPCSADHEQDWQPYLLGRSLLLLLYV